MNAQLLSAPTPLERREQTCRAIASRAPLLQLQEGSLHSFELHSSARISATSGTCWVTREGDPEDHILAAGETLLLRGSGRVVVEPLSRCASLVVA